MTPEQIYKSAMKSWVKELVKWQLAHPELNWLTELCAKTTAEAAEGGDRPPLPPPKP